MLSKKEANVVAGKYDLGKMKEFFLIQGGLLNYNFLFKTDKGEFIIRILGSKLDKKKKDKLKTEFKVLNFLDKNNFPYSVPVPILNKNNKEIYDLEDKKLWVYKKLEGNRVWNLNKEKFKEIPKALAIYHKFVSKLKVKENFSFYDFDWLVQEYKKMKKVKPKNKIDKLMLENIDFFEKYLLEYNKINLRKDIIPTHSDFSKSNMLFKGNKIVAFLDFDNLEIAPKIKDVAYSIKQSCFRKDYRLNKNKMNLFLKEYRKYSKLTKEEEKAIIPLIILDNCLVFWWFYREMKKKLDKQYVLMLYTIKTTKNLVKELK